MKERRHTDDFYGKFVCAGHTKILQDHKANKPNMHSLIGDIIPVFALNQMDACHSCVFLDIY